MYIPNGEYFHAALNIGGLDPKLILCVSNFCDYIRPHKMNLNVVHVIRIVCI